MNRVAATSVSIIVPVFNEAALLEQVLERIDAVDFCGLRKEIVIVDDGSTDGSTALLKKLSESKPEHCVFLYHARNLGKGAAIRTAVDAAGGDIIIIQDADLEYDPREYPRLIRILLEDRAEVVYGSRLTSPAEAASSFSPLHFWGNRFLTGVTNLLYATRITDMETCYKAFRASVIKGISIRSNRFDFEPEITAKLLKRKVVIYEVPISYQGRDVAQGKKISWMDGFGALWALVKFRFTD